MLKTKMNNFAFIEVTQPQTCERQIVGLFNLANDKSCARAMRFFLYLSAIEKIDVEVYTVSAGDALAEMAHTYAEPHLPTYSVCHLPAASKLAEKYRERQSEVRSTHRAEIRDNQASINLTAAEACAVAVKTAGFSGIYWGEKYIKALNANGWRLVVLDTEGLADDCLMAPDAPKDSYVQWPPSYMQPIWTKVTPNAE